MSELTLATIQSKVSVSAYEQLAREFTDEALQEMSSSGGLTLTKNHNVQMGWHTNTAGEIDGVFLRMLSEDSLGMRTWLIGDAPQTPHGWTAASQYVSPSRPLDTSLMKTLRLARSLEIPIRDTQTLETLAMAFQKQFRNPRATSPRRITSASTEPRPKPLVVLTQAQLEEAQRALDSAQKPEEAVDSKHATHTPDRSGATPRTRKKYNFTRIGASLLVTLVVLYAVKKFFVKSKPPPSQIVPPIQPNGQRAFTKPIAT